jgi:hypothetical protein
MSLPMEVETWTMECQWRRMALNANTIRFCAVCFPFSLSQTCLLVIFFIHIATPCDENQVYLLAGTPPTPPPIRAPDNWTLYRDRVEFELADFLYRKVQMSGNSINILSQLWRASLINHGAPPDEVNFFENQESLYATIDSTPIGEVVWQGFSISPNGPHPDNAPQWKRMAYDVWHRDTCQLLHNLLANPDFDGEFDYIPFCKFDAQKR